VRLLVTAVLAVGLVLGVALAAGAAGAPHDRAAIARNVLPPGETGGVVFDAHATDQLKIYDALTPLFDQVTAPDVDRYFKPETLWTGGEKATRVERPRAGVVIRRDEWDVPHIFGKTQQDVSYGLGWVSAEDRGLLMELARGPARISAIDAPALDAFSLAQSGRQFVPSAQTEAFLATQLKLLSPAQLANAKAFVAGINAQRVATKTPGIAPWTPNDVVAMATLIGARFGAGGGDEVRRSMFLDALRKALGRPKADGVWSDLRETQDPETLVTSPGTFPWGASQENGAGNAVVDDGSFALATAVGAPRRSAVRSTCRTRCSSPGTARRPAIR